MRTAKEIQEAISRIPSQMPEYECGQKAALEWVLEGDGWIKCSDRLPDKEGYYLIYFVDGFMKVYDVSYFNNGYFANIELSNDKVTHWQPLLDPPEESK